MNSKKFSFRGKLVRYSLLSTHTLKSTANRKAEQARNKGYSVRTTHSGGKWFLWIFR